MSVPSIITAVQYDINHKCINGYMIPDTFNQIVLYKSPYVLGKKFCDKCSKVIASGEYYTSHPNILYVEQLMKIEGDTIDICLDCYDSEQHNSLVKTVYYKITELSGFGSIFDWLPIIEITYNEDEKIDYIMVNINADKPFSYALLSNYPHGDYIITVNETLDDLIKELYKLGSIEKMQIARGYHPRDLD